MTASLRRMGETATILAFAVDVFSGMGPVEARRMFGGAGLYADGVMFGLIDDDVIHLRVDETVKAARPVRRRRLKSEPPRP